MGANSVQHGGNHYRNKPIQPWDYVVANGIGYLEGNAIKYLSRWREKGGVDDLLKARHYVDKLIEVATAEASATPPTASPAPTDGILAPHPSHDWNDKAALSPVCRRCNTYKYALEVSGGVLTHGATYRCRPADDAPEPPTHSE